MPPTLEEIQDDVLDRVHAGETVDEAAVLAAHPDHAEDLQAFFSVIALVEGSTDTAGVPPTRLGEYRIIQEIGRGGMGVVYEAEQTSLKRRVALKILPPMLRMDKRLIERFGREAEAAGRLRHPGIVPVYAVGEAAGTPFFAMELVEGTSLQQILNARRAGEETGLPTDPVAWQAWAVESAARVADALAYAHAEGILHRDVKPANIMLDTNGDVRLTDFGLAQDLRAPELTQTGEVFGSPQYMSPEQAIRRDAPVDGRSDVYSLAVTLYELLTLQLPYDGTTNAELLTALTAGKVTAPRRVNPEISRPLEAVLLRALRLSPLERYADAEAFAKDLRAALAGERTASRAPVLGDTKARVAVGVLAFALVGLIAWSNRSGSGKSSTTARTEAPFTPTPARDVSVIDLMGTYEASRPQTLRAFQPYLEQLKAIDSQDASLALRRVYTDLIATADGNHAEARAFLGHREFVHHLPALFAYPEHPFLQAVTAANNRRWFPLEEHADLELALKAWEDTQAHVSLLKDDPKLRAVDTALAQLAQAKGMKGYHRQVVFADPYLICYLSNEPVSPYETLDIPGADNRHRARQAIARRSGAIDAALSETMHILHPLHAEFMAQYAKDLKLKPLTNAHGGRPDYPPGTRKFRDGTPFVVVLFESRDAFTEYHHAQKGSEGFGLQDYFSPRDGVLYSYDRGPGGDRALEFLQLAHNGVHQIDYWYTRQRLRWQHPPPSQNWFGEGWADYLGAVQLPEGGTLRFTRIPAARVVSMQRLARALQAQGKTYPVFPIERLTSFGSYAAAANWVAQEWALGSAMELFYAQSWALVHFLNEGKGGAYRKRFRKVVDHAMSLRPRSQAFQAAFELKGPKDPAWAVLDEEFQAHVRGLLKLDVRELDYAPAPRGSLVGTTPGKQAWGVVMKFELDVAGARRLGQVSADSDDAQLASEVLRVIRERLRAAGVGRHAVITVGPRRFEIGFEALPVARRDKLVELVTRQGTLEFRIEVLPDAEYRKRSMHTAERSPRTGVWPDSDSAFEQFKSAEIARWKQARAAGTRYVPSRAAFHIARKAGTVGDKDAHFHVLEVPAQAQIFDGRALEEPRVSHDQINRPVVNFNIRPEYRKAFGDWTEQNRLLPLAIIVDGEVHSTPQVNARLDTDVQITLPGGPLAEQERRAKALVIALQAGSLPLSPNLVSVEER